MSDSILVEHGDDGVTVITFNRPEQRNSMSREARTTLLDALEACVGRSRVIVLTGTGTAFSAGIDLKEASTEAAAAEDSEDAWAAINAEWAAVQDRIRSHPAIVIAAVNGFALGGGSTLVNLSDLAIAADTAQIGTPEVGFGSYPGIAGPAMQLRIAPKRAAWLVLTTKRIDGKTAERWGMVNLSVPLERLMQEALELARHVAQFDAATLAWSKKALWAIPGRAPDWESAVRVGAETNRSIQQESALRDSALGDFISGARNTGQGADA